MKSSADQAATSSNDTVPSRQKKKWHIKVRTGCGTCKRRRVKCDETKPTCKRCVNSHHVCDGYASVPKAFLFVPSKESAALFPKSKKLDVASENTTDYESAVHEKRDAEEDAADFASTLTIVPGTPYKDTSEQFALKFWLHVARPNGFQQPKNFLVDLFATHMPQAAWSHSSVRHGLVAAASIVASHEYARSSDSRDTSQALAYSTKQQQLAISSLIKGTTSPEVSVLTALILYVAEAWSGRMLQASMHLAAAHRISEEAKRNASKGNTKIDNETFKLFATFLENMPEIPRYDATVSDTAKLMCLTETELAGLRRHYAVLAFVRAQAWMNRTVNGLQNVVNNDIDTDGLSTLLTQHKRAIRKILEKWTQIPLDSDRTRYAANMIEQDLVYAEEYPYTAIEMWVADFLSGSSAKSLGFIEARLVVTLRAVLLYAAQSSPSLLDDAAAVAHYIDDPR